MNQKDMKIPQIIKYIICKQSCTVHTVYYIAYLTNTFNLIYILFVNIFHCCVHRFILSNVRKI